MYTVSCISFFPTEFSLSISCLPISAEDVTHDFLLPSILDYRMSERGACCNLKGFKVMLPSQSPNSSLSLTLSHSDIKEHERDYSYSRIRACLALFLSNGASPFPVLSSSAHNHR